METLFIFKIIIVILALLCAINDARHLIIPNKYILAMIALFPVGWVLNMSVMPLTGHLIAGGLIFGLSFVLFSLKLMGGGDSKMAAAIALWLGLKGLIPFIMGMAITGGVLAAISLIVKKNQKLIPKQASSESWFGQLREGKSVVPYGIAIAVGAICGLF